MKKILVLTDFLDLSVITLRDVMKEYGSELCEFTILHCFLPPADLFYPVIRCHTLDEVKNKMQLFMEKVLPEGNSLLHQYEARLLPGPAKTILEVLCALEDFDLVVQPALGSSSKKTGNTTSFKRKWTTDEINCKTGTTFL